MSTSGTPAANLNEHKVCQVRVTLNRKCARFKRREKRVFRRDLVNEMALCYLQPLVKRLGECVCVCTPLYMFVHTCLHACVFFFLNMCDVHKHMCAWTHAMSVLLLDRFL